MSTGGGVALGSTILVNLVIAFLMLPAGAPQSGPQSAPTPYANSRSPHGNLNMPCQNCHTAAGWKPVRPVPEFDHNKTRFPLRGMHEGVACTQCHTKMVFTNVGNKCADCHADIHRRQFGANCEQCHNVKGWNVGITQVKQHENRFPLIGAHAALDCESCHKGAATGQFQGLSTQCYSCHATDYQQTNSPAHAAAGFSTTCEQCHSSMDNWSGVNFDHLKATGYALTGAHATLQCSQCHINNQYKGTPATCVGCHLKDFQGTTNPNHVASAFPQTCQQCHTTTAWIPATFDHNTVGFALTGAHATVPCSQCHVNNNYNLTVKTCVSCHLKDYQNTNNPNHAQQGFAQTCDTCHNTAAWMPATFNHNASGFPLTGAHATLQCAQCHINNNYNLTSANTACVSCHLKDYQGTNSPNHVTSNFPQTCQQCHSTTSWGNANWNHSSTGFALTGAHATLQCAQCHINNNYTLTSANTACVSCHLKDYQGTTDPNHVTSNFPQTCEQCHNTTSWGNANWDHSSTGFALTGAHATIACSQCHVNNNYNLTSANTACVSCHLKDYQGTTDPNHVTAGFPQTCQQCHNTSGWGSANWNHSSTGFALTGSHATLTCQQCHVNNNYGLTAANAVCSACHMNVYTTTNNPPHAQVGFPTTCDMCHDTVNWMDGSFNHNNTPFPLTGYHANPAVTCAMCHVNNNYTTLPTICSGCHMKDYNGTNNPNHAAAAWPTTCDTCHNTSAWIPANLPPQYHTMWNPNHGGANSVCSTCHQNQNDYSVFQCTNCHTKAQTDSNHQGVSGYVYNSVNCYNCHKNGGGGGG